MRIGIDLGGTKIEGVLLSAQGELVCRYRAPTPQGHYQAILAQIAELVGRLERQLEANHTELSAPLVLPVGIGMPGSISTLTGKLKNSNTTCLNHQAFQEDISALLKRPVSVANDANCFALSEAVDGAARDAAVVFGVILGTGVGGGLVFGQRLHEGLNGLGGEWGHNPLPATAPKVSGPDGLVHKRLCYCGHQDCIETYLSGPGLATTYQTLSGIKLSAEAVVAAAKQGDNDADQALDIYMEQLAAALATVINMLDPDVIVLGGGLSNIDMLYQHVPQLWAAYVFSDEVRTRLVAPQYGDSSGVRGAAWLNCDAVSRELKA
jgi:predicted NBD/HSP70 family sugar kinase